MNKFFTKIAALSVGLAMAIGVGVAVGSGARDAKVAKASSPATITISTLGWGSSAPNAKGESNKVAIDANVAFYFSGGNNVGKYYTSSPVGARMYYTDSDSITVKATTSGVKLTSIKFVWALKNTGCLHSSKTTNVSSVKYPSNSDVSLSNVDSVTAYCANTGSVTNGQVAIQSITVSYTGGVVSPELSDITCSQSKHALVIGDNTGLTLSTTASNRGSNLVTWSASPDAGVTFNGTSETGESTTVKFPTGENALAAGTEVTITASLQGATSKTYKICAIGNAGTSSNPFKAIEAKYIALDGDTNSHYVSAYIVKITTNNDVNSYWLNDNSSTTTGDFQLYNGVTNDTGITLATGQYILAHGTFTKYNTNAEATGSVIDRVDVITLEKSALSVNNTKTATLAVTSAGGDVSWSTTPGTGSVSLSSQSNSSVIITGTSVGTATVTATVGTASASCTVTVVEYAEDWKFKDLVLSTGTGFVSSYEQNATFDDTGITVTLVEHSETLNKDSNTVLTTGVSFNFDSFKATVGQHNLVASYTYTDATEIEQTYYSDDEVTITITAPVGRLYLGNYTVSNGYMKPSTSSLTGKDSFGNNVTITTAATSISNNGGDTPNTQFGSSNNTGNTVDIAIELASRAAIESLSVTYASNSSNQTTLLAYADDDSSSPIISDSVNSSTLKTISTGNNYSKVNASTIHVFFTPTQGVKVASIIYTLGDAVAEFNVFTSLAIQNPAIDTEFKVGECFSTEGLVLRASDNSNPVITKDFSSGFTTDFDSYKENAFQEGDVSANPKTVTVSLTIGGVTKTVEYTITVINPPTYSLVSSQSELYEGMKVILVNDTDSTKTVGAYTSSQHGVGSAVDNAGTLEDVENTQEFTVRIYGDKFALQYGTNFISYYGSSNSVYQSSELDATTAWTYSTSGTSSDGLQSANVSGRYLEFNGSKVACYAHSQVGARIYVSSASSNTASSKAETFIYHYLHMRDYLGTEGQEGSGYCKNTGDGAGKNYFADAVTAYNALLEDADATNIVAAFKSNTNAVKRFQDWAKANGKSIDIDSGAVSNARISFADVATYSSSTTLIIIVISLVGATAMGGYFLFKKKKQY